MLAPERVKELERWGAVFDRTSDGKILQRNFGGHRYPRLAHVGDRTGLELIRTLQDHGVHQRDQEDAAQIQHGDDNADGDDGLGGMTLPRGRWLMIDGLH